MISCCGVWLSGRRNWRRKRAAFEGLPSEFLELGEADGSMSDWAFWTSELKVNMAISHGVCQGAWNTSTLYRHAGLLQRWSMIWSSQVVVQEVIRGKVWALPFRMSCLGISKSYDTNNRFLQRTRIYSLREINCFSWIFSNVSQGLTRWTWNS